MKTLLTMILVSVALLFSASSVRAQVDYKVTNVLTAESGTVRQYVNGQWESIIDDEPCSVQFKFCSDDTMRSTDGNKTVYKLTEYLGEKDGISQWAATSSGGLDVIISMQKAEDNVVFLALFYIKDKVLLTFITTSLKITHGDSAVKKS